jgi:hypothetical protein
MVFVCRPGSNTCYIFGGQGNNNGATGYLNDLWSFAQDTGYFSSMSRGNYNSANMGGTYGNKGGTASSSNTPGSRDNAAAYFDTINSRLIVYGGHGYVSTGTLGYLNDVWSFSVSSGNWLWLSGPNTLNQAALANRGGARCFHAIASASSNSFYVFGGDGYGTSAVGDLHDLWLHTIADTWSLVGGSISLNLQGDYFDESATTSTTTVKKVIDLFAKDCQDCFS